MGKHYVYCIGFFCRAEMGRIDITVPVPIYSTEQVRLIEADLTERFGSRVTVTAFSLYAKPPAAQATPADASTRAAGR